MNAEAPRYGIAAWHLALAHDSALSIGDRYRQLATYYVVRLDYRRAIQALYASTAVLDRFAPLPDLAVLFRGCRAPLWLVSSGEAASYPRCTVETWIDVENLSELHAEISSMAISLRVKSIHGAASYILSGQYGFAVQCLKASDRCDTELSLAELVSGDVSVDDPPLWVNCWR